MLPLLLALTSLSSPQSVELQQLEPLFKKRLSSLAYKSRSFNSELKKVLKTANAEFRWEPKQRPEDRTYSSMVLTSGGLAVSEDDGPVHILDSESLRQISQIEVPGGSKAIAWNSRTGLLAILGQQRVNLFSLPGRKVLSSIAVHPSASILAYSPDGTKIAVGYDDGEVRIYNVRGGNSLAHFHLKTTVLSLSFSQDSRLLGIGGRNEISIISLTSGQIVYASNPSLKVIQYAYCVRFSSDGSFAAAMSDGTIRLLDPTRHQVRLLRANGRADQPSQCISIEFLTSGVIAATFQPVRGGSSESNAIAFLSRRNKRLSRQGLRGRPVDLISSGEKFVYILLQNGDVVKRKVSFNHKTDKCSYGTWYRYGS